MRFIQTLVFLCLNLVAIFAQELDFVVTVNVPNANVKTDPAVFRALEKDVTEFFNTTKFTEDEFQPNEKIKGKVQITVTSDVNNTAFNVDVSVQTSRPVYNTDYTTPMVNYYDKGETFPYIPGQTIIKSDKTFLDNLSSCLTFYAYLVIGSDYDSFESYGGERYFISALEVFNNLPSTLKGEGSWSNVGINGRTKYWMIENILSPRLREFRQMNYEYHRLALDNMHKDADRNRAVMLSALSNIEGLHQSYPNSYLLQLFSDTKNQEIVEIFKVADSGQRNKVRNLMVLTSAGTADRYNALK